MERHSSNLDGSDGHFYLFFFCACINYSNYHDRHEGLFNERANISKSNGRQKKIIIVINMDERFYP